MSIVRQNNLSRADLEAGLALLARPRLVTRRGKQVEVPPAVQQTADGRWGLASLLSAEQRIALAIKRLRSASVEQVAVDHSVVWGARGNNDADQRSAVDLAAREPVMVITGGPGTGKTTTAKTVLGVLSRAGLMIEAVAPTGKAAARIQQQTGIVASTIHSRLRMAPGDRMGQARIESGVVLVDEASMLDVQVAAALFDSISTGVRVIVMGDVDQLPSVEAGSVLRDLIALGVPVARLSTIHRQASVSRIPYVARSIRDGEIPQWALAGTDVTAVFDSDPFQIADRVVALVTRLIPEKKGISSDRIQVLAAQYDEGKDSHVGIIALNGYLQDQLNPPVDGAPTVVGKRGYVIRLGDKVIQVKNNKGLGVANGQTGRVVLIGEEAQAAYDESLGSEVDATDGESERRKGIVLGVEFEGTSQVVFYQARDAKGELELAYVVSIHKSQGSEWDAVVIVAPRQHAYSLTRSLVYTALTRAAKYAIFVGPEGVLNGAVANTRGMVRRTTLAKLA